MQIEEVNPNKPKFSLVVLMAAVALVAVFLFAIIFLIWRSHEHKKAPFSLHPTAHLIMPSLGQISGASLRVRA